MPPSARTPFLLRLTLVLGLGVLLIRGTGEEETGGRSLSVDRMGPEEAVRLLALDPAPTLVERSSTDSPGPEELLRLAAVGDVLPLRVWLPETPSSPLRLELPRVARAERSSALGVRGVGFPGTPLEILVQGDAGVRDSIGPTPDSSGRVAGAIPLRPVRDGWHSWTASDGLSRVDAGMLVREARPLRVLALGGAPGWESRFVVRALEESGVAVTLRQRLGGGRFVTGAAPSPIPALVDSRALDSRALASRALDSLDVILLLPGGRLPAGVAEGVAGWLSAGGGMVVLPTGGDTVTVPGLLYDWIVPTEQGPQAASRILWSLPPELTPLPPLELDAPVLPLRLPEPADWAVAASLPGGDALLALGGVGAGRAAVVGLPATWVWRMEGGATAQHRDFWRQLVEWAAGAGTRVTALTPREGVAPRAVVHIPVEWAPADSAPALRLERPDGTVEPLRVDVLAPGRGEGAVVSGSPGLYRILDSAGAGLAGFMVVEGGGPGPGGLSRLVQVAGASGGVVVGPGGGARAGEGSTPLPESRAWPLPLFMLLALTLLSGLEWALRRFRGLP